MAEKTQRKVTQVMAKKKCTCPDHFPEPRKPKSVGVKAWGIMDSQGNLLRTSFDSKYSAEKRSEEARRILGKFWDPGNEIVPVMIVPCREGKK